MKIRNINNVEEFFKILDSCKGKVELISPEGDRINLKSKLAQYFAIAEVFSDGYVKELELIASDSEDVIKLMKFMMDGDKNE